MHVAICAQGNDLEALVDPRFARAPWILVADTESGRWTAVDNAASAQGPGGSGAQTAQIVAGLTVSAVITGNMGPNASRILSAGGISVYHAGNGVTACQALEDLAGGALAEMHRPTVAGHWA